jgi:hypothetical protein
MSVLLPPELFRKISSDSQGASESSSTEGVQEESFRELLQIFPTDEKPREKDFFSLVEEEEEDKKLIDGPPSVQVVLNPLILPFASPCVGPDLSFSAPLRGLLPPEIGAIFEKMASCMLVMSSSGEVETTLFLDTPHFASSPFFGTKITIREFSTAPKAFNVEIASSSQAIIAIDSSRNDLLSAFQNGNFNFSIHRLDTYIQNEERPVLHRKESEERDNQEKKGGREQ